MKSFFRISLILLVALFQYRCAQESAPQGGKKDIEPPKIRSIDPPNKNTGKPIQEVTIQFDEFIQDNGFAQVLISPPISKPPQVRVSGKKLTLKLTPPLQPNTTYTVNFGSEIKDLNESNALENFTYVFSTGQFIDSASISGVIKPATQDLDLSGMMVVLLKDSENISITNTKPTYFAKLNNAGAFTINNIRPGRYNIFGLKDQNMNYLYDQPNEIVAFNKQAIEISDTAKIENLEMAAFVSERKQKLLEYKNPSVGYLQLVYAQPVKTLLLPQNILGDIFSDKSNTKDTVNVWYSNVYDKKMQINVVADDTLIDTLRLELKTITNLDSFKIQKGSYVLDNQANRQGIKQKIAQEQESNRALILFAPRPIQAITHPERVEIYEDSTHRINKFDIQLDDTDPQEIILTFEKRPGKKYRIVLPDSLTRDYLQVYNKQSELVLLTYPEEQIGKLKLAIKRNNFNINYLLEIRSKSGLVKSIMVNAEPSSVYAIGELEAGEYSIEIIEDENKNGVWDTGNFLQKRQPEKKYVYDKKIQLKGNWELDFEIMLN